MARERKRKKERERVIKVRSLEKCPPRRAPLWRHVCASKYAVTSSGMTYDYGITSPPPSLSLSFARVRSLHQDRWRKS